MNSSDRFDVVIIGGGPAGLSAALVLGRSRRRILLAHSGLTRNAAATASHGFLTRDGTSPDEILRLGREQLAPYDVSVRDELVIVVNRLHEGFTATLESGTRVHARRLIFAAGVRDLLPDIPGFRELWGSAVFHCPYCHGWEVAGQPLALYGRGEGGVELVKLLLGWSDDLVLFTDGPDGLGDEQREALRRKRVPVRTERVARLAGDAGRLDAVVLESGERIARSGLFIQPAQEPRSDLPRRLGCTFTTDGRIEADGSGLTTVPGIYVAGDGGPNMQQLIGAAASGAKVAMSVNRELLAEDFEA